MFLRLCVRAPRIFISRIIRNGSAKLVILERVMWPAQSFELKRLDAANVPDLPLLVWAAFPAGTLYARLAVSSE